MKSPGIYSFHELRRFSAMMSAGMMNGARDLSVLIHLKSKSPAIGKDTGVSLPVDIGCPLYLPGSVLPIHRHQKTTETMVCLREKLRVEYYDELERICSDSFVIEPGGANMAVSIPIGVWHTVHALESGTCILEMKDGRYEPLSEVDVMK